MRRTVGVDEDERVGSLGLHQAMRSSPSSANQRVPRTQSGPPVSASAGANGAGGAARERNAPEVPAAGGLVDDDEVIALPLRLECGGRAARHGAPRCHDAVLECAGADLGAVPRHVGVVPRDPREPCPVGGQCGLRDEVAAGDDLCRAGASSAMCTIARCGRPRPRRLLHDAQQGAALPAEAAIARRGIVRSEGMGAAPGRSSQTRWSPFSTNAISPSSVAGPRAAAVLVHP